jgi:hypothetical protein
MGIFYSIVGVVTILGIGWYMSTREKFAEPKDGDTYIDRSQTPPRLFIFRDEVWEDRGPIE